MEAQLQDTLARNESLSSHQASSQLNSLLNNFYPMQFESSA